MLEVHTCFEEAYWHLLQDERVSQKQQKIEICIAETFLPEHTASHPRILHSSKTAA
jgi:hypothetical protein